jgi:hypothetical protein
MREKGIKFPARKFDDLRMVKMNIPMLQEVLILSMDQEYEGDTEWMLKVKGQEKDRYQGALVML